MPTINEIAKELLEAQKVSAVIGFARGTIPGKTQTIIARTAEQAEKLVFNNLCVNNLVTYLTRSYKLIGEKPVAIVVKGCDARTIVSLLQENQLKREQVYIIGVVCEGVVDKTGDGVADKCVTCMSHTPKMYDVLIGEPVEEKPVDPSVAFAKVIELERMSAQERWDFWAKEFEKCVKCYACRQACPLCYCERCVVDKTTPQWIDSSAHPVGNFSWHITRAFHLAGRCIGCGECERVCHQNIPLGLLNKKMGKEIMKQFGYRAGVDPNSKPPLTDYKMEDNEDFIR